MGTVAVLLLGLVAVLIVHGLRTETPPDSMVVGPENAVPNKHPIEHPETNAAVPVDDKRFPSGESQPNDNSFAHIPDSSPPPPEKTETRSSTNSEIAASTAGKTSPDATEISRPTPPPRTAPEGLTGISREYDDMQCRRIQHQFGVRIPAAAMMIEVDGERLPVDNLPDLQRSPSPFLLLPRGVHAVRWRLGEQPNEVEIDEDFLTEYLQIRRFFNVGDAVRTDELLSRGARALDVHGAPFLLNFMGASYIGKGELAVAERKFRRAVRVNPLFSPAHLNLAHCLSQRGQLAQAARELALADAFNVGNVFGLQPAISQLRQELGLSQDGRQSVEYQASVYVSTEPLSVEDERLVALMTALSKYAVREEDRGKILNNLAAHFAESQRPELALEHFREALGALKYAGPDRFELTRKVFSHMTNACRKANYAEAEEYAWMQEAVMP